MKSNESRDQNASDAQQDDHRRLDAIHATALGKTVIYDPDNTERSVQSKHAVDLLEVR